MKDLSVMVGKAKFNYRAGIWIERGNQVFIEFKPTIDFTTIPGGRVKALESSKEALIREIQEEMHITLKEDEMHLKTVLENFFEYDNVPYHELYFLYQLNVQDGDNRFVENARNFDSEASYYRWIEKNQLEEIRLLPEVLRNLSEEDKVEHIIEDDLKGKVIHE